MPFAPFRRRSDNNNYAGGGAPGAHCQYCGAWFRVAPSASDRARRYCTPACYINRTVNASQKVATISDELCWNALKESLATTSNRAAFKA